MSSSPLQQYLTVYHGINDWHLYAFRVIAQRFTPQHVLYPGSWNHITPSLVFPHVVYIELSAHVKQQFQDSELRQYIQDHAEYPQTPQLIFHRADYRSDLDIPRNSFDLLLSLSAGLISRDCQHYLTPQGYLLANNAHHDASLAYVDPTYLLIGVFPTLTRYIDDPATILHYFHTTADTPLSQDMVLDNIERPPSKARYKLKHTAPLYLFQRNLTRAYGAEGTMILPDYLTKDLVILFVGTAASDISAEEGHYYANPSNRFWPLLFHAGLTDHLLSAEDDSTIVQYGLGLTDVVKTQHSGDDTRLVKEHVLAGRQPLQQKIQQYAPNIVCFTSKNAFHAFFGYRAQSFGLQAETIGGSRVFITPSPSPRLPASRTFNGKTRCAWFRELRALVYR